MRSYFFSSHFGKRVAFLLAPVVVALMQNSPCAAETIEFPEDELASESVLPVFDQQVSVKNRNVSLGGRVEAGVLGGMSLLEAFYNQLNVGADVTYNLSDEAALNFVGYYFFPGISNNAASLNPIPGRSPRVNMNLQYAPAPQFLVLGNYQYSALYGKISLSKSQVMNLNLYGLAGGGFIMVGDALCPALSAGIGQKFFMGPNWSLRFDLRMLAYQGPDVLSRALDGVSSVQSASSFDQKLLFASYLSLGATFAVPGL